LSQITDSPLLGVEIFRAPVRLNAHAMPPPLLPDNTKLARPY
jgi:hypothetical protein